MINIRSKYPKLMNDLFDYDDPRPTSESLCNFCKHYDSLIKEDLELDNIDSIDSLIDALFILDLVGFNRYCIQKGFSKDQILMERNILDNSKVYMSSLNEYINNNYIYLLDKNNIPKDVDYVVYLRKLIRVIYTYMIDHIDNKVISYLEDNFNLIIFREFKVVVKYYEENPDRIKNLFKHLKDTKVLEDLSYVSFILNLERHGVDKEYLVEPSKFIIGRAFNILTQRDGEPDKDEFIIEYVGFIQYIELAKIFDRTIYTYLDMTLLDYEICIKEYLMNQDIKRLL